jgi:basic membrane protein A
MDHDEPQRGSRSDTSSEGDRREESPIPRIGRRDALRGITATGLVGVAGCLGGSGDSDGDGGDDQVQAAWVYTSEVGDLGWSWAHDQGRKAVDEEFDWLETSFSESVAPADGGRTMREYTNEGMDIVFGTTFEYMDPMTELAENNPDTLYEHCSGYETRENMGRYFGRVYQARYLAGVAAGMVTEADSLGYVAAFPIPEVIRGINAFTLGAAAVNEDVTTKVRWTNTWFDPPTEQEAAQALVDEDVDVMAQHQDSPAAVRTAAEADIWATGYDAPMREQGGDNYLTSPIWHWEEFYRPTLQAVRDDTWESDFYWEGLDSGIADLSEWGPEVTDDVKSEVESRRSDIESGDLDVWADSEFEGESDEAMFQEMGTYVDPVDGTVPE